MSGIIVGGDLAVYPRRQPGLLTEDRFDRSTCGWTQLMEGVHGVGTMVLDSEITYDGSPYSLLFGTEDYSYNSDKPWSGIEGIKRMSRGPKLGKIMLTWVWAWGSARAAVTSDTPRTIGGGFDQAAPSGLRQFAKWRWHNYDEALNQRVSEMRLLSADGSFIAVPTGSDGDAKIDPGVNENKRNLWVTRMVLDWDANGEVVYDGLAFGGENSWKGWGSLASTPDTSLRAIKPPPHTLTQFAGGCNATWEHTNRTNTNDSKSWSNLAYFRAEEVN